MKETSTCHTKGFQKKQEDNSKNQMTRSNDVWSLGDGHRNTARPSAVVVPKVEHGGGQIGRNLTKRCVLCASALSRVAVKRGARRRTIGDPGYEEEDVAFVLISEDRES
jgi:hypothetical protein